MFGGDRLGPDFVDAELVKGEHAEHAGLDVGADADHGSPEIVDAELAQRIAVGRVGLHDVGELVRPALHQVGVLVDGEHLVPQTDERGSDCAAEPAEADDDDAAPGCRVLSQRSDAPQGNGTASSCCEVRARSRR